MSMRLVREPTVVDVDEAVLAVADADEAVLAVAADVATDLF